MTLRSSLRPSATVLATVALLSVPVAGAQAQESALVQSSGKWAATLLFTGRMAGDVRVEPAKKDTESQARIDLRNAPLNRQIAWEIAEGVCGDNAAPIQPRAKFRQMLTGNDGSGSLRVTTPRLVPGKRYYVRVIDPSAGAQDDRSAMSCTNMSEEP